MMKPERGNTAMDKGATKEPVTSAPARDEFGGVDQRGASKSGLQRLPVEEITGFLGRAKHQRRGVDMQGQSRRSR